MSKLQLLPLRAWAPDLVTPDPNSWVVLIASMFRAMAYLILAPIVILTVTDITAWAIARTLGADLDADRETDSADIHKTTEAPIASPPQPTVKEKDEKQGQPPPQIELPSSPPTFATDLRFTTPGEANYELSGLFSPPISRAGSPGISLSSRRLRSSSTSLSAAGSDSEGPGGEGSRLNRIPGLGMTPVDGGLRAPEGSMARRRTNRSTSDS